MFGAISRMSAAGQPPEAPAGGNARQRFFDLVDMVAARDRLTFDRAMLKAKSEWPTEFIAAFPRDRLVAAKANPTRLNDARIRAFDTATQIAHRDRIPTHAAIAKARSEHPELFATWH